jgi:peptide chain release factor subunit 1
MEAAPTARTIRSTPSSARYDVSLDIGGETERAVVTRDALDRLATFEPGDARVLTAYLDVSPERRARRTWAIVLKDLAHDVREGLGEHDRSQLDAEIARARDWLDSEPPGGRGVAIFSCASRGLWEANFLPEVERDELTFGPVPHLAPLIDIVDDYERYAVAHVDKERARLFTVFMAQIEETRSFEDEVPGKHDQGGPAQMKYQRDHEKHVLWHLKRVVQELSERLERRSFDRLVIAGPEEATRELRTLLPDALASRLVDVIPLEGDAGKTQILEATLEIERRVERQDEDALVTELLEAVGAHGHGSCGVADTVQALQLGAVHTLVLSDGLRVSGSECPNCGWMQEGTVDTCPICGTKMRTDVDIADIAARRTLETAGEVEVVHEDAARRLTERCGGMGAVLRFRAG